MRNVIMLETADKNLLGSSNNLSHFAHKSRILTAYQILE